MVEETKVNLAHLEEKIKSNSRRIEKLEEHFEALNELAVSVGKMANEMEHMRKGQDKIDDRLRQIEEQPGERLGQIFGAIVVAVIGVCVGFFAGGM